MKECPLCKLTNIPEGQQSCPQCDADLSCFTILDSLSEQPVRTKKSIVLPAVFITLVIGITSWSILAMFSIKDVKNEVEQMENHYEQQFLLMHQQMEKISEENDQLVAKTEHLQESLQKVHRSFVSHERELDRPLSPSSPSSISGVQADEFFVYVTNEDDTLWGIAQRYYGQGKYYPVLLEENPSLGIYSIEKDLTVKILRDREMVEKIYHAIVRVEGDLTYYYYTVRENDTIESIAEKFYGQWDSENPVVGKDRDTASLKPGQKLKITLR